MESNYKIYKFYKGEKENPFEEGTTGRLFWPYESAFEADWRDNDPSDWYAFFETFGLGKRFLNEAVPEAKDTDSIKLDKKKLFSFWLDTYLFKQKLSPNDKARYQLA